MERAENSLYYGDNLDVLRRHIKDESVDLVYLDPPFKSNQNYNVLFAEQNGSRSAAQIKAFEDTWRWDQGAAAAFEEVVEKAGKVSQALQAFRTFLGESDMMAYLAMMAPRLLELRRVLKPTGSIYLHCDPTASHYLKVLLDSVFGAGNFRNEIVWRRTTSKALMKRRLPSNHDLLLCYQETDSATWNLDALFEPYDPNNLDEKTAAKYTHRDPDGRRYQLDNLINPNPDRPNLTYTFLGFTKVWRWTRERMQAAYDAGLVIQPRPGSIPRYKRYLDEQRGKPFGDVWTDIPPINSQAQERLGYPTQKPEALLQRIIKASSNEGEVVLDPFCGCGTAIAAAQKLGRHWIGIDITYLAVGLIKKRLRDAFGDGIVGSYQVIGEPTSLPDARQLASDDPLEFQRWAVDLVSGQTSEQKRGADRGIDGRIYFHDETGGKTKQIILSVKSGHLLPAHLRDLRGVIEREKAQIGVLICLEAPSKSMRSEIASAGFYKTPYGNHPRLQILTIKQLLEGARIDCPPQYAREDKTFKKAPKAKGRQPEQKGLPMVGESDI